MKSSLLGKAAWGLLAVFLLWPGTAAGKTAAPQAKRFTNSLGMAFVLVPAGKFLMGSPKGERGRGADEAQHPVTISRPFYMQTTEVTLGQWWALMGKKFFGRREGPANLPVAKVSWFDAADFISALNRRMKKAGQPARYRLPTEAEWEYAARAGTTTRYAFGDKLSCRMAMVSNNTFKSARCVPYCRHRGLAADAPAPVASFAPNPWGLYDMHGNLWEWVADWYGPYPRKPRVDPTGPGDGWRKVRRGGSWFGGKRHARSANRNLARPASKYGTLGFRLVLDVK